jgi:peptidoglycan/LPS O-acetylase OafA/YrhL
MVSRNPALDGLRAVAALAVLFFHTRVPGFAGGAAGVDVFFVLSGYLITKMLADGRMGLREFWSRRARRLIPALVLLLAAYVAFGPWLFRLPAGQVRLEALAAGLYLTDITTLFRSGYPPLNHTWSLAVEEQFYILWPLVLPVITRAKKPANVLLLAWAVLTLVRLVVSVYSMRVASFSPLHSTGILLGAAIAIDPPPARFGPFGLAMLCVVFVFGENFAWSVPVAEVGAAALIPALLAPTRIAQAFAWRPAVELGVISYGVYLWHDPILQLLPGSPLAAPITLALSVVIAALSFHLVEKRVRAMLPVRSPAV